LPGKTKLISLGEKLDSIYEKYNKRKYVDPDPLLFLYDYPDIRDREIAGLVAACLAYGRVEMIMKTLGLVLEKMGPSPFDYLSGTRDEAIDKHFKGFKYRFAKDSHLSCLLKGIKHVILEYGSLENCFRTGLREEDKMSGLSLLYREINKTGITGHLLADPQKTSACKRSHLFLRWMVRKDEVDPGGWDSVSPEQLIIPLDTHMYFVGKMLGFTKRKNPDKTCALEITAGFRKILKHDPVKYDFSLTRFGIQRNMNMDELKAFIQAN
jgi:uncharacterized protein (TIGR02757 family)